jgi:hypothetical protein
MPPMAAFNFSFRSSSSIHLPDLAFLIYCYAGVQSGLPDSENGAQRPGAVYTESPAVQETKKSWDLIFF